MALIPPYFLDCVSAIGTDDINHKKTWKATGFLVGRFFKKENEQKGYHVFLITNKHVLKSEKTILVRFNALSADGTALDFPIQLLNSENEPIWTGHQKEEIDVAAINISPAVLRNSGAKYQYFLPEHISNIKKMQENGISEGDFVYALGFPMGIVDPERQYVISRSGTIARIRDTLEGKRNDFIIELISKLHLSPNNQK